MSLTGHDIPFGREISFGSDMPLARRVTRLRRVFPLRGTDYACKPGSVEYGHLSCLCVAAKLCATRGYVPGKRSAYGVASDRVYICTSLPTVPVSSYLAFPSLPRKRGGLFLLHFPGSRLRRTLSVILPCEARTFLTVIPFGMIPRDRTA